MSALWLALAVGIAGSLGAVARVWLDLRLTPRGSPTLPLGTLTANAVGCLLLGAALGGLPAEGAAVSLQPVLTAGLCGGLSTYSSFSVTTMTLWLEGAVGRALVNALANLALGGASAATGWALIDVLIR
ncbi:fluoride efflux transporter FluC [Zhihengliuella flava]|uniref:Fluoride-specific ion channel FluC n=1 Tax=Zhihengliuella flava TaxID=1285193 RepID=A0A931GE47_9MICC|nr:CrcB family protein [Zhihengliuella flava]MBG6083675.1 CrcB protein [Zhihengliuella flava]